MTVTTPSSTAALRFSTTKIDALIKKSDSSSELGMRLDGWVYSFIRRNGSEDHGFVWAC